MLLSQLLAGCSPSERAPGAPEVDTLRTGLVQVRYRDTPGPVSTGWSVTEDLRLGGGEGTEDPVFGHVTDIADDPTGRIYVLDGLARTVLVFGRSGRYSHSIGSEGRGPGELTDPVGIDVDGSGRLWVVDTRLGRYSVFDPDGSLLATYRRPLTRSPTPWPGLVLDGAILDWGLSFPDERAGVVAGERVVFTPVHLDPETGRADTLPPLTFRQAMLSDGTRPMPFFSGSLVMAPGRDGTLWFSGSGEYRVWRRAAGGDTTLTLSLSERPSPVTDADVDSLERRFAARPEALSPYLDELPEAKPIIRRMLTDTEGRLYVLAERRGVPAGTELDVFDEAGYHLARIPLPRPISPRAGIHVSGDRIYVVVTDEMDVPSVFRLRVQRPS